ncbi:hypothetical protein DHD05_18855 [Arenibacter sp. N53]|uniref:hypothetical protein n=1 Tax=Arenibacter TaxID=178469 RepID=UPI000CD3D84F|nr:MULTISPECIES: hypothetical protein [Arenibacter]MCM4153657.1 hypothetical protein [Arenibacter sp. N53]
MNRYIKAMEIGLANEKEGISYFDLLDKLQIELDYSFNSSAEVTFMSWFNENFESHSKVNLHNTDYQTGMILYLKNKYGVIDEITDPGEKRFFNFFHSFRSKKSFLKGNAAKQYLDYQELQQSVKSANSARNWAIISIIVALFAIGISAYSVISSSNPPYDVKIIEDKTRTDDLQKENKQLKEELFKAEMMVKVLEETKKTPLKK